MNKFNQRKNSIQGMLPVNISCITASILRKCAVFFLLVFTVSVITSCEKDEDLPEEIVQAPTGIRLVNSTFLKSPFMPGDTPDMSPVDLYVDDVKITTSSIAFSNSSAYFPLSSGSRKIEVKNGSVSVADTVLNIMDGRRYTFFVKDRSFFLEQNTNNPIATTVHLKRGLLPVIDNNTSAPATGQAKVRFVNTSSLPLNVSQASITFLRVNPFGSSTPTTVLTQSLGYTFLRSDFSALDAGQITFRAHGATTSTSILDATYMTELTVTLEAGKLYTVYVMSTEHVVKTITKSPISLKIIENN